MKRIAATAACLCILLMAANALAESVPLVPWAITHTGSGSVAVSTNGGPDQIYFNISNSSGSSGTYGYATSASNLLTITSNTIYVLSARAWAYGPGGSGMSLLANGSSVAGAFVHTGGYQVWSNYIVSFTTAGPEDARIGQGLQASCLRVGSDGPRPWLSRRRSCGR